METLYRMFDKESVKDTRKFYPNDLTKYFNIFK